LLLGCEITITASRRGAVIVQGFKSNEILAVVECVIFRIVGSGAVRAE